MNALLDHVWGESLAQDRVWAQVTGLTPRTAVSRPLMVLQAFIDDSFTPNGVFVMAGYVASAETWANFSGDWAELLPYGVLDKNGRYHFKMAEMAMNDERMSRVGAFYRVIERHNLIPIAVKFNISEMKRAMSRLWMLGKRIDWTPFNNHHVLAFHLIVQSFNDGRSNFTQLVGADDVVDFIFDSQQEKAIIISTYEKLIAGKSESGRKLYGATPRFEDDKEFLPLQAADLWAWWIREWYEEGDLRPGRTVSFGPAIARKATRMLTVDFNENQLVEIYKGLLTYNAPNDVVYDSGASLGQVF